MVMGRGWGWGNPLLVTPQVFFFLWGWHSSFTALSLQPGLTELPGKSGVRCRREPWVCNSFIPAPGGYGSGEAGTNNPPVHAATVNSGAWGGRSPVIVNNFIPPQVAVRERGKNCEAVDGRWLKCWRDTHGGRDGLGTCVRPRGKPHRENCCGTWGAAAGCRAVPCQPLRRGQWGVTGRWCASPTPYEAPLQKAGRWRGWQHPPCTGHPQDPAF